MTKNARNLFLAYALAIATMLVSCGHSNNNNGGNEKKPSKQEAPNPKLAEKQKEAYYQYVLDSVKNANGATALAEKHYAERLGSYDDFDIRDLKHPYTLAGVMEQEVKNTGFKIIENTYQQIVDTLAEYGVKLDNYISQDSANFILKTNNKVLSKYDMCFVDVVKRLNKGNVSTRLIGRPVEESWPDVAGAAWDDLVSMIYSAIDYSKPNYTYNKNQNADPKSAVNDIVKQAHYNLVRNYESVEEKHNAYYTLSLGDVLGISYYSNKSKKYDYGYDIFNSEATFKVREIVLCNQNLDDSFFHEEGAKYKPISLGQGKWQIVKTKKNGQTERTHIFYDNTDFEESWEPIGAPVDVGITRYFFDKNKGLFYYAEVAGCEERKDFAVKIPEPVQHQIDSLQTELNRKRTDYILIEEKEKEADSIAQQMVAKHFGAKEL